MVIHALDSVETFPYKQPRCKVFGAFRALADQSGTPKRGCKMNALETGLCGEAAQGDTQRAVQHVVPRDGKLLVEGGDARIGN